MSHAKRHDRRTALLFAISASAVVAAANAAELVTNGTTARIRDLRVLRLLARVVDLAGANLLAALPHFAHAEIDVHRASGIASLAAAAAFASLLILIPIAAILRVAFVAMFAVALAAGSPLRPLTTLFIICTIGIATYFAMRRASPRAMQWSASISGVLIALCAIASLATLARATSTRAAAPSHAPNIILISIDSLRADHLHAYGYARETSPNLDRLASEGVLFETVIAPTSWTLPSHMTLMTSLPPEKHGVTSNRKRLSSDIATLPQRLQREGYYTGGIVSATYLDGMFGFSRGFDEYDDYSLLHAAGARSAKQVSSPQLTELALSFLRRRAGARDGRPFFLFLHMFDVHYDYNPPAPFAEMFDPAYGGATTGDEHAMKDIKHARDLQHVVALYDGEIAFVDAHIGNLLRAIDALHLRDDTIVAVVADHGEEFFEHGRAGHFKTLYDEVLHVPLLIRYPSRIPAGKRIEGQVRLMDVPQTLMDLAGLRVRPPQSDRDATSLAAALRNDGAAAPTLPAFGDLNATLASLRTPREKLIWNLKTNQRDFYDLVKDPGERHAVASSDKDVLAARLEQWRSGAPEHEAPERGELSDEERSSLQSLGYLDH